MCRNLSILGFQHVLRAQTMTLECSTFQLNFSTCPSLLVVFVSSARVLSVRSVSTCVAPTLLELQAVSCVRRHCVRSVFHLSCQSTFLSLLLSPLPRLTSSVPPDIFQSSIHQPGVEHLVRVHLSQSPSTRTCCCCCFLRYLAIRFVSFRLVTVGVEASRIISCVSNVVSYRMSLMYRYNPATDR